MEIISTREFCKRYVKGGFSSFDMDRFEHLTYGEFMVKKVPSGSKIIPMSRAAFKKASGRTRLFIASQGDLIGRDSFMDAYPMRPGECYSRWRAGEACYFLYGKRTDDCIQLDAFINEVTDRGHVRFTYRLDSRLFDMEFSPMEANARLIKKRDGFKK